MIKDAVKVVILGQKGNFSKEDIARKAKCSYPTANNLVSDLVAEGLVFLDHKSGKKSFFAVSGGNRVGGKVVDTRNIMSLSPEERFKYTSYMVDMVTQKISPSLLITGISGIGKTFLVEKRLAETGMKEGMDYHLCKGHSTPFGLYAFLHNHRDATLVFDDCDSVFKEETSVNILKSSLDSYTRRKVCWNSMRMTEELEKEFNFEGSIIFISNMNSSSIDEAVVGRTIVIDLQMTRREIVEYLMTLLNVLEPNTPMDSKVEVLDYLKENCESFKEFNIRTFIKACRIRRTADLNKIDWKKMVMVLS